MAPRGTKRAQQAAAAAATAGTPSSSSVPVALPRVHPPAAPSSAPAKSSRRSRRKQAASPAPSDSRKSSIVSTEPTDRLSPLSSELLALILHHLSPPASRDLPSLVNFALVSKTLLPHVRAHMYRELRIDTRVQAHSLHRSLHGNDTSNAVRAIEADVGVMAKTSSQWMGELGPNGDFDDRFADPPPRDVSGWFLFHSMHSLCGIIGVCRSVLSLTLYLPSDASAWTQSLCASLVDVSRPPTPLHRFEVLIIIPRHIAQAPSHPHQGHGSIDGQEPRSWRLGGHGRRVEASREYEHVERHSGTSLLLSM